MSNKGLIADPQVPASLKEQLSSSVLPAQVILGVLVTRTVKKLTM